MSDPTREALERSVKRWEEAEHEAYAILMTAKDNEAEAIAGLMVARRNLDEFDAQERMQAPLTHAMFTSGKVR